MSLSEDAADLLPGAPLSRAPQLARRLIWLYGVYAALLGLIYAIALLPLKGLDKLRGIAGEFVAGGLGVVCLVAVILALTGLIAMAILAFSRLALRRAEAARLAGELPAGPPDLLTPLWRLGPGVMARHGQAIVMPLGFAVMALLAWRLWPVAGAPAAPEASLVAALVVGLTFPSLIAERMMAGFPAGQAPETPGVRRALLIVTVVLAVGVLTEVGRILGFGWIVWVQRAAIVIPLLVGAEWGLRALGRLFLPTPTAEAAKGATDGIVAALLTGGPRAPAVLIRQHLGLDFARSWALAFLTRAAGWAFVATLVLCWVLSGVKLLGDDQRGVYERFGAPVGVLGPGFHLLLPWPFGRMRPVEYGVTHTIAVGAMQGPDAYEKDEAAQHVGAEDVPQANLNRLWDTAHATEAEYLVASQAEGQQGFQVVNGEILVIYRTGLSDRAAMQSVYGSADQAMVVEEESNRLFTRFFSSHTLEQVLGGQREGFQGSLRADLQRAVDTDKVGVDIVAVLIDAIHPPAGAAVAYHSVQAAEITADASVAQATAHATRTTGEAQAEAYQSVAAAQAVAVEKVQAASGDAYQFGADRGAYRQGPASFLLERRARNLTPALKGVRLMVVDSRLTQNQAPIIDMRGAVRPVAAALAPPSSNTSADMPLPGTSTEGPAPPETSEQDAEESAERARGQGK
jgi:regulator of protease activity HflC (stomatin/prohibitin superfamily)